MPRKNARPAERKRRTKLKSEAVFPSKVKRVGLIAHHAPGAPTLALMLLAATNGGRIGG